MVPLLMAQRRLAEMENLLNTLLAADVTMPGLHCTLESVFLPRGRWSDAERAYLSAAETAPAWPHPHRCLYKVLKRHKNDPTRAAHHMATAWNPRHEIHRSQSKRTMAQSTWM